MPLILSKIIFRPPPLAALERTLRGSERRAALRGRDPRAPTTCSQTPQDSHCASLGALDAQGGDPGGGCPVLPASQQLGPGSLRLRWWGSFLAGRPKGPGRSWRARARRRSRRRGPGGENRRAILAGGQALEHPVLRLGALPSQDIRGLDPEGTERMAG